MRVLGLDVGRKRIGVALGDTDNHVAVGLPTLINNKEILDKLKLIILEKDIQKLIIGYPKTMSGQNGEQVDYTQRWTDQAVKVLKISVEYVDERLSSKMARDSLAMLGKDLAKEDIDQAAAVLILQSWLDRSKNTDLTD